MQKKHRIIPNLPKAAAVLLSVLILASCGISVNTPTEPEDPSAETDVSSESTRPDYAIVENDFSLEITKSLASLEERDYGGVTFLIATPAPNLINEDECGAFMSKYVSQRNEFVAGKYNVTVRAQYYDTQSIFDLLSAAERAGDYFADAVMIPQESIGDFANAGLLFNMNSLPFFNPSAGYNIESGMTAAMGNSTGYAMASWATLEGDKLPAVFFNTELIEKTGLESPYELVKTGRWTWDAFLSYLDAVDTVNSALAAEGLASVSSWGTQNSSLDIADIVYVSEGNRFITSGLGTSPTVSLDADASYKARVDGKALYNHFGKHANSMTALSDFANGDIMFLIDSLGTVKHLSNSPAVWGVLPMPKAEEGDSGYIGLAASDSLFFAIPAGTSNAEEASLVLSAINAASAGLMTDGYVNYTMYYYLRENGSVEMVERICDGAYFDMAYSFGTNDTNISNGTYFGFRNSFEMEHDINFYINRFSQSANRALLRYFPQ